MHHRWNPAFEGCSLYRYHPHPPPGPGTKPVAESNHALEYAIRQANELRVPLVVVFGLMHDYPKPYGHGDPPVRQVQVQHSSRQQGRGKSRR